MSRRTWSLHFFTLEFWHISYNFLLQGIVLKIVIAFNVIITAETLVDFLKIEIKILPWDHGHAKGTMDRIQGHNRHVYRYI